MNFTLDAAKRIVATVKRVEAMAGEGSGARNPQPPTPGATFWGPLTGCDAMGLWWDWLAVTPIANIATLANPWSFTAAQMWSIRQPYTAGWGNAREANGAGALMAAPSCASSSSVTPRPRAGHQLQRHHAVD